jgi:hypothetical protein
MIGSCILFIWFGGFIGEDTGNCDSISVLLGSSWMRIRSDHGITPFGRELWFRLKAGMTANAEVGTPPREQQDAQSC